MEGKGGESYLAKGSRGLAGSAPKFVMWRYSVGGIVRQTPMTILSPVFRVNMAMLLYPHYLFLNSDVEMMMLILFLPAVQSAPIL